MNVSKLKNIVIAVLVLVNLFFLIIIVLNNYTDAKIARQAIENVCTILNNSNISINTDCIEPAPDISTMRTMREEEMETMIAEVFLNETSVTEQGVIRTYENPGRGTAEFSSAGDFEIYLKDGAITNEDGSVNTVVSLLRDMRIDTTIPSVSFDQGSEIISVESKYRATIIYNCTITFIFSGNNLNSVKGRYVSGIEPTANGVNISYVGTALLGLLAAVKRGEVDCTDITKVEAGFMYSAIGSFGESVISPVWLIITDTGRYIVDSATGDIRPI